LRQMTENKNIEVEYLATAKDYRRVLFWYSWKRQAIILAITVLIGVPLLYAYGSTPSSGIRPPVVIVGFLLFLPLLVLVIFMWGIRRQAAKIEKIFEPAKVVFSGRGMHSTSESASAQMNWEKFHKVYETKEDFIFFPQHTVFYTIPKRFFNKHQIAEFKELLREKLDNRAKLLK